MTDTADDARNIAYLALGRLIAGQCPPGFATARLTMEIGEDQTRLWILSTQPDGTEVQLHPADDAARDILESLRAIRRKMAEEDGKAWRRCTITLRAGGHFALDVDY
ncbi:MAG TPA: hypothetical protein VGW40_11830 [Allosphingosinicella sp.]|nr:hypothetical protein [Allosphingosinicella sp.]